MKWLIWAVLSVAAILFLAFPLAWVAPVAYLKVEAFFGFGPVSMPWAISLAHDRLAAGAYDDCAAPFLFAWYGSFGGGPYVPDHLKLPPRSEFEEIILIHSGIVTESTKVVLSEMAQFNENMIHQCFGPEQR
ncbi:hypothetical protein [uncultured Roseobacter sp.]|uniref:hypothetical protein n=1 Tax=uncultured Roseobacter sp. TaxID=114847 RepID=UPI0026067437|nr:hypothetical protein [uncultured Roseobacter sp.]